MGVSNAERQRRFRDKRKAELGDAVCREDDAQRKRLVRTADPESATQEQKEKIRNWRDSKKAT